MYTSCITTHNYAQSRSLQFYRFTQSSLVTLFTAQSQLLTILRKRGFENIVARAENAGKQHFLFPQCFLRYEGHISCFKKDSICRLQMLSNWANLKFCRMVKG